MPDTFTPEDAHAVIIAMDTWIAEGKDVQFKQDNHRTLCRVSWSDNDTDVTVHHVEHNAVKALHGVMKQIETRNG